MKRLLLLSGPIASGKTSVSAVLQEHYGFAAISSSAFLREQLISRNEPIDRYSLQELGDSLDRATDFSWLIDSVARPAMEAMPHTDNWLVDAVRKPSQVQLFRLYFAESVRLIHITAPESVLRQRSAKRGASDFTQYDVCVLHPNEQTACSLTALADKIFNTEKFTPLEIADQILTGWEK